jgi:nucleotide-binding universal stress UspA family protein
MDESTATPHSYPEQILCALDREGRADHAVQAAIWLSERLGAPLEIVHAFPPRPILWGREADMPEWQAGREASIAALRGSLREIVADAPRGMLPHARAEDLRFDVKTGHPVQVILEEARRIGADLVVLGPHEKRNSLDLGSTARGVLAHARGGVWVQPGAPRGVKRILAPVDLSPGSLAALTTARDLARRFEARVTAVLAFELPVLGAPAAFLEPAGPSYVVEHARRAERVEFEAAMNAFAWSGVEHETRFVDGDPADSVLALQDEHDLVVMGTHGRSAISAALLGSVAYGVLRSAKIPVLAMRHPAAQYAL